MNYALPSKFLRNLSCRFFVSLFVIFIFGAVLSSVTVAQEELKFGDSFTKVTKDPPEGKVDSPVESAQPPPPAPPEYADKHMPDGYWGNPDIIAQGKAIFIGAENIDVNCASCHGKDGKPVKAGARDFRQREHMAKFSDSQWFWRISEGWGRRRATQRHSWKGYLSEDERWKVIAYALTFSLKGMKYDVAKGMWVNAAAVPSVAEETESADVQLFRSSKLVQDLTTRYLFGSTSPLEVLANLTKQGFVINNLTMNKGRLTGAMAVHTDSFFDAVTMKRLSLKFCEDASGLDVLWQVGEWHRADPDVLTERLTTEFPQMKLHFSPNAVLERWEDDDMRSLKLAWRTPRRPSPKAFTVTINFAYEPKDKTFSMLTGIDMPQECIGGE